MDRWDDELEAERLHFAVQEAALAEVRRLIEAGEPVDRFDSLGNTPLHDAVEQTSLTIARLLLEAGADVNAHDERVIGNTPLAAVAQSCSLEIARFLIEAGADPTIPGWMGLSALDRAGQRRRPEGRRVCALLREAARKIR